MIRPPILRERGLPIAALLMSEDLRCGRLSQKSMDRAVTSTSILPCFLPESLHPMIRFPRPARPLTECPSTVAWPSLRNIRIRRQGESNDYSSYSVRGAATVSPLAHGRMHYFYAVHRRRHDLNCRAEIFDADPDSQAIGDFHPRARTD